MIDIFDQLRDFRLTDNGKLLLRTIPRSILFKAKRDYDRIQRYIPCYKVNTYYAICLRFCELQKAYPDWGLAGRFDINQEITKDNEKFSMRLALKIEAQLEKNTKDFRELKDKLLFMNPDGSTPDPLKPLKDAIATGRMNIKGLKFLRSCFATSKPKLVHEINKYIQRVEQDMIENIKSESNGEFENQKNISCINIETVL